MKKLINKIAVRLWGVIPFKDIYEHPEQKINFWNIINFYIKNISE